RMRAPSSLPASFPADLRASAMTYSPRREPRTKHVWSEARECAGNGSPSAALHHPRHVAGHEIDLEIGIVADRTGIDGRDLERALEIDACPGSPAPDGGHPQRLGRRICGKPAAARLSAARHGGQAHSVAGDGGTDLDGLGIIAASNGETDEVPLTRLERSDLA